MKCLVDSILNYFQDCGQILSTFDQIEVNSCQLKECSAMVDELSESIRGSKFVNWDTIAMKLYLDRKGPKYSTMYELAVDIHSNIFSGGSIDEPAIEFAHKFFDLFADVVKKYETSSHFTKTISLLLLDLMKRDGSELLDLAIVFGHIVDYTNLKTFLNDLSVVFDNAMKRNDKVNAKELKQWVRNEAKQLFPLVCMFCLCCIVSLFPLVCLLGIGIFTI